MSILRRKPQQGRGERRVAQLLEAASSVMVEMGSDQATMTAIAERAGASIGTLYQYFPDKDAVLGALREQYVKEFELLWVVLRDESASLSLRQFVSRLVDMFAGYIERRPAYLPLMTTPRRYTPEHGPRNRLRENLIVLFQGRRPEMSREEALRVANIMLQTLKGINPLFVEADALEKAEIVQEFKTMMLGYLTTRLKTGA